jgi:iron(II)-dependent oxidoreductase
VLKECRVLIVERYLHTYQETPMIHQNIALLSLVAMLAAQPAVAGEMTLVPAGGFVMGCSVQDKHCDTDERPAVSVNVPAFRIDRNEVSVAEFRACVETGRCRAPKTHALNKYCNYGAPGRDAHPVNCVDWEDARNYCQVQGKRLPREAEWEKAARAGTRTAYHGGDRTDCSQSISNDNKTTGSVRGELDGCGEDRTWPVASRPANAWGLHDMHGNAGEWVANRYAEDALAHYARGALDYPAQGERRVVRGGSWDEKTENLRASFRNSKPAVSGQAIYGSIGFRCALDAR